MKKEVDLEYSETTIPLLSPNINGNEEPFLENSVLPELDVRKEEFGGYKDVVFLFLFIVNLVILAGIAVTYGGVSLVNSHAEYWIINTSGTEREDVTHENIPMKFLMGLILVVVSSTLMSLAWVYFLSHVAASFMNFLIVSMTAGTALSGFIVLFMGYPYFAFTLMALALLIFALSYLFQNRIEFASLNLQVACQAIIAIPGTMKYSLYLTVVQGLFLVLWAIAAIGFSTNSYHITKSYQGHTYNLEECSTYKYSSDITVDGNSLACTSGTCYSCLCDGNVVSANSPCFTPKFYLATFTFLVLSLFWVCAVISNVVHCTTSAAVSSWWRYGQCSDELLESSFDKITSKSLGSICFGSLLTAIVRTIRSFLHFISARVSQQNRSSDDRTVIAYLNRLSFKFLVGFTDFLDRMVLYFNRYAFCFVALYGVSYIEAAKLAADLFKARGLTTLFNDDVIDLVVLVSEVIISLISLMIAFIYARSTGITGTYLYLFELCAVTTGYLMSLVILSAIQSAVTAVYVCFAKNPTIFEHVHPTLYAPLANSWVKIFPGCLALSETRTLQQKKSSTHYVTSLNQQNTSKTIRGTYNPPDLDSSQTLSNSTPTSLYSSMMRMVQPSKGVYDRLPASEESGVDGLNRSQQGIFGPWGGKTNSAVSSLGLAIKDLAKDPFGLSKPSPPIKGTMEDSYSI